MPGILPQTRMSTPQPGSTVAGRPTDPRDQFITEHMRRIYLLIYRRVGSVDDAQDLTQEVFIKVLQRQDQLRDPEKAAQWLSRIATNTAIDFLRRHKRVSFTDLDEMPPIAGPSSDSPELMVLRTEKQSWLESGLQTLTDRERTALLLRDVEDMPAEEVAQHLECSKATVRSHIANARVKFKKFLEKRGHAQ